MVQAASYARLSHASTSASASWALSMRTRWVTMAFQSPAAAKRFVAGLPLSLMPMSSREAAAGWMMPTFLVPRSRLT